MAARIGQLPSPSESGTWIAIWYKPAEPGASEAPYTIAGTPLMVTTGAEGVA
jgi:hypothetical protein